MTTATLTWIPAGTTNSINQDIFYKKSTDATFLQLPSVNSAVSSTVINGLDDDTIYDFKVVNNCTVGGPTTAAIVSNIKIICPTVTLTPAATYNTISYSFPNAGLSITSYVIDLLNASGTGAAISTNSVPTPGTTVTGSFTGLSASTNYNIRVTTYASSFSKICGLVVASTLAAPVCNAPTNVAATMS